MTDQTNSSSHLSSPFGGQGAGAGTFLIIGQGIAGTMLSWYLHRAGVKVTVVDRGHDQSPSHTSAGLMNPVTGRRYVTAWRAEEIITHSADAYDEMASDLGVPLVQKGSALEFFAHPEAREGFVKRIAEGNTYLSAYPDQNDFNPHFRFEFGTGEIAPVYTVAVQKVLSLWREKLAALQSLDESSFDPAQLENNAESLRYKGIDYSALVFCDGLASLQNPLFSSLPFVPVKGEALIIRCPGLPRTHVYKRKLLLIPYGDNDLFWVGSTYDLHYTDTMPSARFKTETEAVLRLWIKHPFETVDHISALRPATVERRPFVGMHPQHLRIGLLNGMGTKGISLAPWCARQLTQHLLHGEALLPEIDIKRFARILAASHGNT